jgi:FG-GAP-like repeat
MRTIPMVIFLLATIIAPQALAQQPCPTLTVSNTNDAVNGNISSPCTLIANPGPDGISLREAVAAANNAAGAGTITITFAAALAGQTIAPSSSNGCCYIFSRDNITVLGLVDAGGQPSVTVDASNMVFLFSVTASNFTLSSMRIVGMQAASPGAKYGVYVRAGENPGELQVSDAVIVGNVFSNSPGQAAGIAVVVGAAFPNTAPNAVFSNAVIANNTFTNFTNPGSGGTDAVKLQAEGSNSTVQNVSILHNKFTTVTYPIELVPAFSNGGRILNTRIAANSFSGCQTPVIIDPSGDDGQPSTGNTVDGTTIERNTFTGNSGPAIMLIGGIGNGSTVSATQNAITNTKIINNLITGDTTYGAVSISGGRQNSSQNTVSGVSIVNNTIANYSGCNSCGAAIDVENNLMGGTNNTASGVAVLNTILWNNTPLDLLGVTPSQVATSLTAQSGFAGINGTIASNPQFVNSTSDFHLQSGSPARHTGTDAGAPAVDLDCQPRGSPPSIGAYEFDGPNICPAFGGNLKTDMHDFSGDGYSDLVWRNTNGDTAIWLMSVNSSGGAQVLSAVDYGIVPTSWHIVGQRDFNGDGKADLLWSNTNGDTAVWLMNGIQVAQSVDLGIVGNGWSIVGIGDFNGDGYGDILWRNTNGDTAIWLMNGTQVLAAMDFGIVPTSWAVAQTGDFNGDGKSDILWHNSNGDTSIWLMTANGTQMQVLSSTDFGIVPTSWSIAGTGDFNGDGKSDILWHNSNGDTSIWLMTANGTQMQILSSTDFGIVPPSWTPALTGDFNGDGKSDILWRNTNGDTSIWFMTATGTQVQVLSVTDLGGAPTSWVIQGLGAE